MRNARTSFTSLILLLAGSVGWSCSTTPSPSTYVDWESPYVWADSLRPQRLMIIGDLQPTTWFEEKFLRRSQNDSIRERMIDRVVEEDPELLLMLGDYVGAGEREEEWRKFDSLMAPICRHDIPTYAVIGNHDYGLLGSEGIAHCARRFPNVTVLPSLVFLADSVAMVVVDSNLETLPEKLRRHQERRYREIMKRLDRSPSVKGIIVASHHPPFTNADLPINPAVRETFVPPFMEAKKALLFLSGHIHSYERFEIDGKTFVVSGGGGGPRRKVDTSASRPVRTDQYRKGIWRYHHYVDLQVRPEGIRGEVQMLVGEEFRLGDGFALRWR